MKFALFKFYLYDGQYKASKFLRYSLASSQSSNSGANPACKSVVYKPHMLPLLLLILLHSPQNREVAFFKRFVSVFDQRMYSC
jgi:hypothetical protein